MFSRSKTRACLSKTRMLEAIEQEEKITGTKCLIANIFSHADPTSFFLNCLSKFFCPYVPEIIISYIFGSECNIFNFAEAICSVCNKIGDPDKLPFFAHILQLCGSFLLCGNIHGLINARNKFFVSSDGPGLRVHPKKNMLSKHSVKIMLNFLPTIIENFNCQIKEHYYEYISHYMITYYNFVLPRRWYGRFPKLVPVTKEAYIDMICQELKVSYLY